MKSGKKSSVELREQINHRRENFFLDSDNNRKLIKKVVETFFFHIFANIHRRE